MRPKTGLIYGLIMIVAWMSLTGSVSALNATLNTRDGFVNEIHRDYMGYVEDGDLYIHHLAVPILQPGAFITTGIIFETQGTSLTRGSVIANATLNVYVPWSEASTNESLIVNIAGYKVSLGQTGGLSDNSSYCQDCEFTLWTPFVQFPPRTTEIIDVDVASWDSSGWYQVDVTDIIQELVNSLQFSDGNNLGLILYGSPDPNTEERWLWSNVGDNMPYIDIEWTPYTQAPPPGQETSSECYVYNGWLICPPPSNDTGFYTMGGHEQQDRVVYSAIRDEWLFFVNDANMTGGAGLGIKVITETSHSDTVTPVFVAPAGEFPFYDYDVAINENGSMIYVWILRQSGSNPGYNSHKDWCTFIRLTVNSSGIYVEETQTNIANDDNLRAIDGMILDGGYGAFVSGKYISAGNLGSWFECSENPAGWSGGWYDGVEQIYIGESGVNPPNDAYHRSKLVRTGDTGYGIAYYVPQASNAWVKPYAYLYGSDAETMVKRAGYNTADWTDQTFGNQDYYPSNVYAFDIIAEEEVYRNNTMAVWNEALGGTNSSLQYKYYSGGWSSQATLISLGSGTGTVDMRPTLYTAPDGTTRVNYWHENNLTHRFEYAFNWTSLSWSLVSETTEAQGHNWTAYNDVSGGYDLDDEGLTYTHLIMSQNGSGAYVGYWLPADADGGTPLAPPSGTGSWNATKGNQTLTGDDYEEILNLIGTTDPDPLDPEPPGWEDENPWFTRPRIRLYYLIGGLGFIFVPLFLWSTTEGVAKVELFWIMLICWTIGFGLLLSILDV